jgi:hypothetical protein
VTTAAPGARGPALSICCCAVTAASAKNISFDLAGGFAIPDEILTAPIGPSDAAGVSG